MKLTHKQIINFQTMIFLWWKENERDLPWRHTHNPYHIHVSEVMLQQTQVIRVIPTFHKFLTTFPTVQDLASSSTGDVIIAWKGMGYNRRALYIKKTAEVITSEHNGIYPQEEQKLLKLPGLGIYTARAILVFAYKQQVAFVDTNIKQIIEHYFFSGQSQTPKDIQSVADQLLPKGQAWEWHQALMDYGALALGQLKTQRTTARQSVTSKQTVPFKETNRFIRGRIMDLVRDHTWEEDTLIDELNLTYDKSPEKITYNLNNLISEGLLERKDTNICLPE